MIRTGATVQIVVSEQSSNDEPPDTGSLSVAALVAAAAAGDASAWNALVDRHAGLVWSVARGYRLNAADAADVSQTVWLRLVENLDAVRDPARIAGWLATTARRECLRLLKSGYREMPDDDAVARAPVAEDVSAEALLLTSESQTELWHALSVLTERCQRLLRVFAYYPDLSYAEVSAALSMPIGSLGPTRGRCLDALRAALIAAEDRGTS